MSNQRRLTDNQRDQLREMYRNPRTELHADERAEVEIGEEISPDGTVTIRITRTAQVMVPDEWVPYKRG